MSGDQSSVVCSVGQCVVIVLNDVPVNACNDTYVSSSYVCLESAFCLRSYLVFPWEIKKYLSVRSVLSILTDTPTVHFTT